MSTQERLEEIEREIEELKEWKRNCNMLMAGWGGCLMAVMTIGGAIAHYYQEIKAYLQALWAVK